MLFNYNKVYTFFLTAARIAFVEGVSGDRSGIQSFVACVFVGF